LKLNSKFSHRPENFPGCRDNAVLVPRPGLPSSRAAPSVAAGGIPPRDGGAEGLGGDARLPPGWDPLPPSLAELKQPREGGTALCEEHPSGTGLWSCRDTRSAWSAAARPRGPGHQRGGPFKPEQEKGSCPTAAPQLPHSILGCTGKCSPAPGPCSGGCCSVGNGLFFAQLRLLNGSRGICSPQLLALPLPERLGCRHQGFAGSAAGELLLPTPVPGCSEARCSALASAEGCGYMVLLKTPVPRVGCSATTENSAPGTLLPAGGLENRTVWIPQLQAPGQ